MLYNDFRAMFLTHSKHICLAPIINAGQTSEASTDLFKNTLYTDPVLKFQIQ